VLGLVGDNSYEWVVFFFAIVSFVGVVFPLDQKLPPAKLQTLIKKAGLKTIIKVSPTKVEFHTQLTVLNGLAILRQTHLKKITVKEIHLLTQKAQPRTKLCLLLTTSGTTGAPKIVKLTAANLLATVPWTGRQIAHNRDDIFYCFLPYCHVYAIFAGLILPLVHGAQAVVTTYQKNFITEVKNINPTIFLGVPLIYERFFKQLKQQSLLYLYLRLAMFLPLPRPNFFGRRLRFGFSAGAALAPATAMFFARAKLLLLTAYGMTETASTCTLNLPTKHRLTAAGVVPQGEIVLIRNGEVLVKGANVTCGYYREPALTRRAFTTDGYFKTGDLGYFEDGFLFITGRRDRQVALANGKKIIR
jgi:long-chain acyl-CoA synthetase